MERCATHKQGVIDDKCLPPYPPIRHFPKLTASLKQHKELFTPQMFGSDLSLALSKVLSQLNLAPFYTASLSQQHN